MEEAIRLGDARSAARLGQELERAKSREFQAARESAAQAAAASCGDRDGIRT
jgi:hypothetical protein